MKNVIINIILFLYINNCYSNIYIAYYATIKGNTGHIGIAIDNYDIKITDFKDANGNWHSRQDSVANGTVTYFDLWPSTAVTKIWQIHQKYEPQYIQYPQTEFDEPYFLEDLYMKGIPKKKKKSLDGLLQIESTANKDFTLLVDIQAIMSQQKPYNAVDYNCTNFVMEVLEKHFKHKILLKKEYILYAGFHTSNKLFRYLIQQPHTQLLIDPKEKVKGRFFKERFWKPLFHRRAYLDEKIRTVS